MAGHLVVKTVMLMAVLLVVQMELTTAELLVDSMVGTKVE